MQICFTSATQADFICHNGRFHADDVFSTVLLGKVFGPIIRLSRVSDIPNEIDPNAIVYDIGGGTFDHHQAGGNGTRPNGIPYASFGLLWIAFGKAFCEKYELDCEYVFPEFDKFIEGIDAYDNGWFHNKTPIQNISNCIAMFNSTWDNCEETDNNAIFARAVDFAEIIFDNVISSIISRSHAFAELSKTLKTTDSDTLYLSRYIPYSAYPGLNGRINFIVYPSDRGGYNLQIINRHFSFHPDLLGLTGEELRIKTGIESANFVHNSGRIGGTGSLFDIPALQKYIILHGSRT